MTITRAFVLRFIFTAAMGAGFGGCALDTPGSSVGPAPDRIPSADPAVDQRLDDLEIVCETKLAILGNVVTDPARPADVTGCWEFGTWTITPVVATLGCNPQQPVEESYTYRVFADENENMAIEFAADPGVERAQFKISHEGGGTCNGIFEHFGTDGVWDGWVLSLHPVLHPDGTIDGEGAFSFYGFDPL